MRPDTPTTQAGSPAPRRAAPWAAWLLLLALLPVGAWVLWQAQRTVRADFGSLQARLQVVAWAGGTAASASPEALAQAQADIEQALRLTPDDPALHERLGDVHFVRALRTWADQPARAQQLAQAGGQYRQALQLRPSEPQTWAMLATVLQGQDAKAEDVHQAWARAVQLGPFEGHVMPILLQVVLANWRGASPAMQAWAKQQFDQGTEGTRQAINALAGRYGLKFSPDAPAKP
jgi:tetratricopeptide (TPR) repeat protein